MKWLERLAFKLGELWYLTWRGVGATEAALLIVLLGIISSCGYYIYYYSRYTEDMQVCNTVAAVGGCSRGGSCGVVYEDGSKGIAYMPVVGEKICRTKRVYKANQP